MNRFFKILIVSTLTILLHRGYGCADTIFLRNGDKLLGDIKENYFALKSAYGQIVIKKAFLKKLSLADSQTGNGSVQTINNDFFTGIVLNKEIQINLANKSSDAVTVSIKDLELIMLEAGGTRYQLLTGVFTMKNNDRFSAKLLAPQIKVRTDYMTTVLQTEEINRIDFINEYQREVRILLNNGGLIQGELLLNELQLSPDSLASLSVPKSEIRVIQLNASKMLLKEYRKLLSSEKDGDGDRVSDGTDRCPNTPWGVPADEYGCPEETREIITKKTETPETVKPEHEPDRDNDGVPDALDQCPQTPQGAKVDAKGCWVIQAILFEFDSDRIKPQYYPILDEIVAVLKKNPDSKIEIRGRTDNIGSEIYNQALSERRARAVKEYMARKGVEPQQIAIVGYGAKKNINSNETEAGRILNRNVEIVPEN